MNWGGQIRGQLAHVMVELGCLNSAEAIRDQERLAVASEGPCGFD